MRRRTETPLMVLAILFGIYAFLMLLAGIAHGEGKMTVNEGTQTHSILAPDPPSATAPADFDFTGRTVIGLPLGNTNQGTRLISGGGVAYTGTGLNFIISAAKYYIGGIPYSSLETPVTLHTADPSNDRIDVFYVDNNGLAGVITGTPGGPPLEPSVDPTSQLKLTTAYVPAASSTPTITVEQIYLENTEWTMTTNSSGTINLASTNNPFAGTKCIEGTNTTTGNYFQGVKPASGTIQLSNFANLVLHIRSKAAWPAQKSIVVAWTTTAPSGSAVIKDGMYNFNSSNTTTYQQIVIPVSVFGTGSTPVSTIKFTVTGTSSTIGWYIDNISVQSNLNGTGNGGDFSTNVTSVTAGQGVVFADTSGKLGTNLTGTGVMQESSGVIGTVTMGTGITYNSGTHTLSATGSGGSVTSFSAGNASPLFTTSVSNSTTTPALSFTLGNGTGVIQAYGENGSSTQGFFQTFTNIRASQAGTGGHGGAAGTYLGFSSANPYAFFVRGGDGGNTGGGAGTSGGGAGGSNQSDIIEAAAGPGGPGTTSGTAVGGVGGNLTSSAAAISMTGGTGGTAGTVANGGVGGNISGDIEKAIGGQGGTGGSSSGATGGTGGNVAVLVSATGGTGGAGGGGSGGGQAGGTGGNVGTPLTAVAGNGGAGSATGTGFPGGGGSSTGLRFQGGNGGNAGFFGQGGDMGSDAPGIITFQSGNGGNGGGDASTASGGDGGAGGTVSAWNIKGGNGGAGGATSSGTVSGEGGIGGNSATFTGVGGNGSAAVAAVNGANGGSGGTINISGGNASGGTAGGNGGSLLLQASTTTPGASITGNSSTAPGGSVTGNPGDLYMRLSAGAGTTLYMHEDTSTSTTWMPVVGTTSTVTLSNKRMTPRTHSQSSATSFTPDFDDYDEEIQTALAGAISIANPTCSSCTQGERRIIRLKDNGTARAITWSGSQFRAGTSIALPTTTTISKTLYVGLMWNNDDSKWDLMAYTDGY